MHHVGDTKKAGTTKGTFDEIQVEIIQAVYKIKALNQGTNKKEGNLKYELDNALSNSRATGKSNEVASKKIDSKTEK
jgi:hypothetical protein